MANMRRAMCRIGVAAAALFAATGLAAPEGAFAETISKVAVVLEAANSGSEAATEEWTARVADAFAGAPGLEVVSIAGRERGLVEAGQDEAQLAERARSLGAETLVIVRLARLGERAGLEARIVPTGAAGVARTVALPATPVDQLGAAFDRLASRVQSALDVGPVLAEADGSGGIVLASTSAEVVEISVSGNRRIDGDAVRAVVGTARGEPLSRSQLAADVRRIYELGFFRDVQVLTDPAPGGLRVEYVVDESPVVKQISLSGNSNVDSDDIKEKLTLTVGATIDYPLVIENRDRIAAYYKSKGYYNAEVGYSVEQLNDAAVGVNYDVDEGGVVRLVEIDFVGNEFMEDDELMKGFQTKPWWMLSFVMKYFDNSGLYAEPIFYQDLDKAQRKYQDQGFIRARLSDPQIQIDDDGLRVRVDVEEGPRFRVGKIDVLGDPSMDRDELLRRVALAPGEVFNRSMLSDDVERLTTYYTDLGYYAAEVRPRTDIDPEALTVDCIFEAEKGDLHFVEQINVKGNTRTREDVVRRELSLVEGELYSAAAERRSEVRVQRLGFFEEVDIKARPVGDRQLAVDVDVVERPTGAFSFGAGFGSVDGFILNGSIRQDNLFGRGYGLSVVADIGSVNSRASLRFTNPAFRGTALALSTGFQYNAFEFDDFEQKVSAYSFDVSYPLDEGFTRVGTGYSLSSRKIDSFDQIATSLLQRERFQGTASTSLVSFNGRIDTRNDIRNPTLGESSGFNFDVAGLGGVNQFLRLEVNTTRYRPVSLFGINGTFVFNSRAGYALPLNSIDDFDVPGCIGNCADALAMVAAAGNAGQVRALTTIDDDLELPISERYILGGIGAFQIRGFEQRSVGARRAELIRRPDALLFTTSDRDANGTCTRASGRCLSIDSDTEDIEDFDDLDATEIIGGNKMFLANFELRVPLSEELGVTGIAFFDMGNAFAEDESFNPADLRFGTGLGAEWLSPFGPILVFVGVPLDRLEDEDAAVFEFSLGGSSF